MSARSSVYSQPAEPCLHKQILRREGGRGGVGVRWGYCKGSQLGRGWVWAWSGKLHDTTGVMHDAATVLYSTQTILRTYQRHPAASGCRSHYHCVATSRERHRFNQRDDAGMRKQMHSSRASKFLSHGTTRHAPIHNILQQHREDQQSRGRVQRSSFQV